MSVRILIVRETFTEKSCIGKMYINGDFVCYTLEDAPRDYGIKIKGKTSIPRGIYKVLLSRSSRFKRLMAMIYTEVNRYELINKGISFKGIRIHGGNTHKNTEGCILVAYNKINNDTIQGTAEQEVTNRLKGESNITLEIKNICEIK